MSNHRIDLIKITPRGEITFHTWNEKDTLKQLQALVEGMIQLVYVRLNGKTREMYINEEGKLESLPVNEALTLLFNIDFQVTNVGPELVQQNIFFDLIVGNVVIVINPDPTETDRD